MLPATVLPATVLPATVLPPFPERDRPNPASLRRRVLLRDGRRCGAPSCHHRAEHCHHILWRSRGGRTALWNETAVCGRCHALIHAGLLVVEGDPALGLRWRRAGGET